MTNTNPVTGIRYGVIAFDNIDPDLGQDLWYTHGKDLSYEAAVKELQAELEREADAIEDQVHIGIAEADPSLVGDEDYEARKIEEAYESKGYDDREDFIEREMEKRSEQIQIDEPVIEGEFEGVRYGIDWLGGAPLLWIFEGPVGRCRALCSPCVPNAGDLDSGFVVYLEPGAEEWGDGGYECYCVPPDWLRKEEN